ncbi:MAG: MchE protein [Planctomycetota bacterium]|jgi:biotin carboxyl carrier protein|nr:MAG: MchE protein [Planctomycetota bacterium]
MFNAFVRFVRGLLMLAMLGGLIAAAAWYRDLWLPLLQQPAGDHSAVAAGEEAPISEAKVLELSPQARQNLKLVSRPAKLSNYWRAVIVPGEITDRPGLSDRGVTSPAVGVVTQVHAFAGDTVRPGDRLFTLRLVSEYIHNTQSELFKVTRDIELETEKRQRLAQIGEGAIPQVRIIEVDQQLRRLQAASESYRQDLLTRGLSLDQIAEVAAGKFVATVDVVAPPPLALPPSVTVVASPAAANASDIVYEVQELKVDLGTQVQAGQLLGVLSNHGLLYIVGHAFKREASSLERAAREHWPIRVEFAEDDAASWPALDQTFEIRHLSNTVDLTSRTFDFFVPLTNQSRSYTKDGKTFVVWRYRPGQRVRLHVPVEELKEAIVLPAAAVVREGPEAYVFRQNGDLFDRRPVRVLHEDRLNIVIANDGSVAPGWYLAQGSAASLNRVLKAQSASGTPVGVHVHADGTVHGAH